LLSEEEVFATALLEGVCEDTNSFTRTYSVEIIRNSILPPFPHLLLHCFYNITLPNFKNVCLKTPV
jgi:hypothetical protein